MNAHPSKYITIHQLYSISLKIRKISASTRTLYTIYRFQKYYYIHQRASPSIIVL